MRGTAGESYKTKFEQKLTSIFKLLNQNQCNKRLFYKMMTIKATISKKVVSAGSHRQPSLRKGSFFAYIGADDMSVAVI